MLHCLDLTLLYNNVNTMSTVFTLIFLFNQRKQVDNTAIFVPRFEDGLDKNVDTLLT